METLFGQTNFREGASLLFLATLLLCASTGCMKKAQPSASAIPDSPNAYPPMGSDTLNAELNEKEKLLDRLLDGEVSKKQILVSLAGSSDSKLNPIKELLAYLPPDYQTNPRQVLGSERVFSKAKLYFHERRFIEAATLLSQVLDEHHLFPGARNLLARCFFFLGNPDRTILEVEFILMNQSNDPDEFFDALFLLGVTVDESNTTSEKNIKKGIKALETYVKVAKESPHHQKIKERLARLKKRLAKKTNPDSPAAQALGKGRLELEQGSFSAASKTFEAALVTNPNSPEILTELGRLHVRKQNIQKAMEFFQRAIKIDSNYFPAWHYKGMAHIMSRDPKSAADSWQKVLDGDPSYAKKFNLDRRISVAKSMIRKVKN